MAWEPWILHSGLYADDGSESTATQIGTLDSQNNVNTSTTYHARIAVKENGAGAFSNTLTGVVWRAQLNALAAFNITATSSVVRMVASANLVTGQNTTFRISDGTGTYIATNGWVMSNASGAATLPNLTLGDAQEVEALLSFQVVYGDVSVNDNILIWIEDSGANILNGSPVDLLVATLVAPPAGGSHKVMVIT